MRAVRIGCGAGYSGDRIDPALELAQQGSISYLVFECLAERTIALAQASRLLNGAPGYDPLLEERMEAVLPICAANKTRIVSNMGAANPTAAAKATRQIAERLGLPQLRVAAITGDDVLTLIRKDDSAGSLLSGAASGRLLSANAYLGAEPIVQALAENADVILTGRVADPSMFLAPLIYEFGWALDDWNLLAKGTIIGHLLECAGQITGGYFADPDYKTVPNLVHLGFPLAEVSENGDAIVTKVDQSGGLITRATCIEQLLYEIEDPTRYLTPDVVADFSQVCLDDDGVDRVRVSGGRGKPRPDTLRVSVGYHDGYVGEAQISYAGPGAMARAKLAQQILSDRLVNRDLKDLKFAFIGINSILEGRPQEDNCEPYEIRLRAVGRSDSRRAASLVPREVEALYTNGPAGGGGVVGSTKETIGIHSLLIPRELVSYQIHYQVS